jgi:hypothetical protein
MSGGWRHRTREASQAKPMREWLRMLTSIDGTGVMTEPESQRGGLFMQETAVCKKNGNGWVGFSSLDYQVNR